MNTQTKKLTIVELGNQLCELLDRIKIQLTGDEDGRLESLKCEDAITGEIRKNFPNVHFLNKGCNREFGDITPVIDGIEYPINVKMVNPLKSGTYNGGGPKTFNYVLFGSTKQISWNGLAKKIVKEKPKKCANPYHYLIYYKNSPQKTVFCSLTDISPDSIVTNPSNPIQLKKNIITVNRTGEEKADFIVGLFRECARKRAQAFMILMNMMK
jgi:hypothetical protein